MLMTVAKSDRYTHNLTVRVIDRDGGSVGKSITDALVSATAYGIPLHLLKLQLRESNLHYFSSSPETFPTDAEVAHDILQEGTWAAVVISEGATEALQLARAAGDVNYQGSSAVHVFFAQARQENAISAYLLPYLQQALTRITTEVSSDSIAE